MAKILKYNLCTRVNHGTEEQPQIEETLYSVTIECPTKAIYEANLRIAEAEAIPGTLDRDPLGEFEPPEEPTQLDRVEAQVTYTAMMTDTLLEG